MLLAFSKQTEAARTWVYQSNRVLSDAECVQLEQLLQQYLGQWQAHGVELHTAFEIREKQFVILTVDESHQAATGCSLDDKSRALRQIGAAMDIDLLNNRKVAFKHGDEVKLVDFLDLSTFVNEYKADEALKLINTQAQTKREVDESWLLPLEDSWLKRYLN